MDECLSGARGPVVMMDECGQRKSSGCEAGGGAWGWSQQQVHSAVGEQGWEWMGSESLQKKEVWGGIIIPALEREWVAEQRERG